MQGLAGQFLRPFFGPSERICVRVFDDKKTGTFKGAKLETTLSGIAGLIGDIILRYRKAAVFPRPFRIPLHIPGKGRTDKYQGPLCRFLFLLLHIGKGRICSRVMITLCIILIWDFFRAGASKHVPGNVGVRGYRLKGHGGRDRKSRGAGHPDPVFY